MAQEKENKKIRISPAKIVLFILLAVVLTLALIELSLRVLGFNSYQIDFSVYRNVPGDITPRQNITWHLKYIDQSFEISINEQGFRNPGKLTHDALFRVLCLGDSSTMGYGMDDDETYPARLASFRALSFPHKIDVLNAGTIGYTIDDELDYLVEKGFAYAPDVVVLEIFFNDVIEKITRERVTQRDFRKKSVPYTPLKSLLLKSAFYHLLRNISVQVLIRLGRYFPENPFDKADLALNPEKYPDGWNAFDQKLKTFIETVKKHKIDLIVVISPDKYQLYEWGYPLYALEGVRGFQDHIISILDEEEIEYVDLMPVFAECMDYNNALFVTYGMYDEHQSEIGQLIKAEEVNKKLEILMERRGVSSLYERFDTAEVQTAGGEGGAYQARKWISDDDVVGIALEGNVTLTYDHVQLGDNPALISGVDLPWWTESYLQDCTMKYQIAVVDGETSASASIFTYEYDSRKNDVELPEEKNISLSEWKQKAIDLSLSLTWKPLTEARAKDPPPRLFISSPLIMNNKP